MARTFGKISLSMTDTTMSGYSMDVLPEETGPLSFAEMLKESRKNKGWSQKTLADRIGVAPSFITQLEKNHTSLLSTTCEALATELGIPSKDLWNAALQAKMNHGEEALRIKHEHIKKLRTIL